MADEPQHFSAVNFTLIHLQPAHNRPEQLSQKCHMAFGPFMLRRFYAKNCERVGNFASWTGAGLKEAWQITCGPDTWARGCDPRQPGGKCYRVVFGTDIKEPPAPSSVQPAVSSVSTRAGNDFSRSLKFYNHPFLALLPTSRNYLVLRPINN